MKFLLALYTLLFTALSSQSQKFTINNTEQGTLIVGMICSDGILMMADSRSTFKNSLDSACAYYDHVEKIYPLGFFQIAKGGISTYRNRSISSIIEEFNKLYYKSNSADSSFNSLLYYLRTKVNIEADELYKNHGQIIMCGYENGLPFIYDYQFPDPLKLHKVGESVQNEPGFLEFTRKNFAIENLTCKYMSEIFELSFNKYIQDNKHIGMGNPIHIIQINPENNVIEIKNYVPIKFNNQRELLEAILSNQINMIYLCPEMRQKLIEALKKVIDKGN